MHIRFNPLFRVNQSSKLKIASFRQTFAQLGSSGHRKTKSDIVPPMHRAQGTRLPANLQMLVVSAKQPRAQLRLVVPPQNAGNCQTARGSATHQDNASDLNAVYRDNRRANAEASALVIHETRRNPTAFSSYQNRQSHMSPTETECPSVRMMQGVILRDRHGRRLDPPVSASEGLIERVAGMRLCNKFHLKGHCSFSKCKHLHLIRDAVTGEFRHLNQEENQALRIIARRSFCRHRSSCNDPGCFAGHRCVNHIKKGRRECSFPEELHFEETAPVVYHPLQG